MTDEKSTPFRAWWERFSPDADTGRKPADRADFARLRRCATPIEAMMTPATQMLIESMGVTAEHFYRAEALAVIAITLAHIREDDPTKKFAKRLSEGDPPPRLSPLRFNRLLRAETNAERIAAFRRALMAAKRKANVEDLGWSLWNFSIGGRRRDREIANWTFAYFGAATPDQPKQGDAA